MLDRIIRYIDNTGINFDLAVLGAFILLNLCIVALTVTFGN